VQNEALPAYCDRQGLQLMAKNLPQLVVPVLEQTPLPRSTWEDTNRTNMAQAYQIMCNTRRGANLDNVGGSQFGKLYTHRDQMTAAGGQSEAPGAKRVLAGARNGNDHFSVWGFAGGVPEKHVHPSQVMQVAGMGKFRISDFTRISNVGFAEAEYYFQPSQPRARWEQVEPLALWSPRWQARLRRVRSPSIPEVAGRLQDATGNVSAFLNTSPPGSNDIASQPQALDSGLGIARGIFGAGPRNLDDYVRTEAKSRNTMLGNKFTVIH
jgi:hypothetical protein